MTLPESIDVFVRERTPYYRQWLFDAPLVHPPGHEQRFRDLQIVLRKVIVEFVTHYERYADLMPVSDRVRTILELFARRPYVPGTYRTDFITDRSGQLKIIEITCRFGLNGFFGSALFHRYARDWIAENLPGRTVADHFAPLYARYERLLGPERKVCVLVGGDRRNESKLFVDILGRTGCEIRLIPPADIKAHRAHLRSAWVISELSFDEIESLDHEVLAVLSECRLSNDYRTVFLLHDKRFFAVMRQPALLANALTHKERALLASCCVENHTAQSDERVWRDARADRNRWVLKPRALGKSAAVHIGRTLSSGEWQKLFDAGPRDDLVLQEHIDQHRHAGTVNGTPHEDYVVGSALFWDADFYGLTEYRTSSHPVTNKVDHRKLASAFLLPA